MSKKEEKSKELMQRLKDNRMYRTFTNLQVRQEQVQDASGEQIQEMIVEGQAVTFEKETVLFKLGDTEYKEIIDRNAFNEADMTDVIFNYNHGGKVIARTRNKTLELYIDANGLNMRARLDGTEEGRKLYEEIKGGYIDRMSFSFDIEEESYNQEEHLWRVLKISKLYDVSAVDFPAYDTTSISARSSRLAVAEREQKALDRAQLLKDRSKNLLSKTY
jgi:HK97 family phage prohead protease